MKLKLTFCIVTMLFAQKTMANTLDNLLKDVKEDVVVVTKSAACDAGESDPACEPVVAECPKGTTMLPPPMSNCTVTPSDDKDNGMALFRVRYGRMDLPNDQWKEKGKVQCQIYSFGFYDKNSVSYVQVSSDGHTPLCFKDKNTCYPVIVTATARCVAVPKSLLNKLGFK